MSTPKAKRSADKKLLQRRERKDLLRRVRNFKRAHLFVAQRHKSAAFRLTGLFVDRNRGRDRAILLHRSDSDISALRSAATKAFGRHNWKMVQVERPGVGSSDVNSGTGIVRDGSNDMGTLGGWLWNKDGSRCFGFSNHHVLVGNYAPVAGTPVWENGVQIGALYAWWKRKPAPVENLCDMATFELDPDIEPYWVPEAPTGTRRPMVDEIAHFAGAMSARRGRIKGTNAYIELEMEGQIFRFTNIISIATGNGTPFSEPGDSGSLLLSSDRKALAVLFGRSWDGLYSYAFPLANVGKLFDQYQL